MSFVLQQPGKRGLLASMNRAATNASEGGGVFAFASEAGIKALFDQPNIHAMLRASKPLRFVVGIDAVTNVDALLCLTTFARKFGFSAYAFVHNHHGTFHPKFSWFESSDGLRLVTGSGNLTVSGLGHATAGHPGFGNWEAFTTQLLSGAAAETARAVIERWFATQLRAKTLRPLDDEEVRDRAMENGRARFKRRSSQHQTTDSSGKRRTRTLSVPIDEQAFTSNDIFLRELSQNRPGQADVGKKGLEFFGFSIPKKGSVIRQTALVQTVSLENQVEDATELRLIVSRSRNFRLELQAIRGVGYKVGATDNRMILVASKLSNHAFRYLIVPVDAPAYPALDNELGRIPSHRRSRLMREKFMTSDELRKVWPEVPPALLPLAVPMAES